MENKKMEKLKTEITYGKWNNFKKIHLLQISFLKISLQN